MPDDQVISQDDAGGEPGQPATPHEATADHASDGEDSGSSSVLSSDQGAACEEPQDNDLFGESDDDEDNQAPLMGPLKLQVMTVSAEQTLAYELSMSSERNAATRPPEEGRVTFRSVTLAELYVGREIDALTAALQGIEWVVVGERFADEVAKARSE